MCLRHSLGAAVALIVTLSCTGAAQQFSFRHYGVADGLQNLAVLSLAQDGAGYIWAGSEGGLYRYDGTCFRLMAADAAGCRNPQPVQVVDETAVRSPAREPVRPAEQTNLPGRRIDARHAARLHDRPYGAVGSLAQPSNVVAP